jgi:hypothetical protein
VNAVTSPQEARSLPGAAARPLSGRLTSALPLLSVYVWLCVVYAVEAWGHVTPWLFGDELDMTQIARSIADTGHPARRGHPYSFDSLYPVVTAPFWLIHGVGAAYAAIKYFDVLLMTAVVFPTYFLARLVVGKWPALFAAAGAGAIPALAYSSYLVEENLAYPYAALSVFLLAKAAATWRTGKAWRLWAAAAALACGVAPLVRGELSVLGGCAVLTILFMCWSTDAMRERRKRWSTADWLAAVVLAFGLVFLASAVMSSFSHGWQIVTLYYKHRMINMLGWAAGTLAIGTCVLPLVGGISALARSPGETRSRELRAVRSVSLAALIVFGLYTALKAAYLSTVFATRVEERNLIYVAPPLFVGTALLLERRRVNWLFLPAAAVAAYLVVYAMYHPTQFPYEMNVQLYSDALGLAILQQANRYLYWTPETARWVLLAISIAVTAALLTVHLLRRQTRIASALAAALAVATLAWTLTGEIAAAAGSNSVARQAAATLSPNGEPLNWVDELTRGKPTLYEGACESNDQNAENLVEFWNRSFTGISSLDGTVLGPGPAGGPNLTATGKLYWTANPAQPGAQYAYAVEDWPCVDFAGKTVASHLRMVGGQPQPWRLVALTQPNRLRSMRSGIYPDHWTGPSPSMYFRFSDGRGRLEVTLSRPAPSNVPGTAVSVQVGTIANGPQKQPVYGDTIEQRTVTLGSGETRTVRLPTRTSRFVVRVVVARTFAPHDYVPPTNPSYSDTRQLGVQVSYRVVGDATHR